MTIAALVSGVIGYAVLLAAIVADSPILARIVITLAVVGLLLLACSCFKSAEGDLVKGRLAAGIAAVQRTRVFRSQLLVPGLERGYVVLSQVLPSTRIRAHFEPPRPDPPAEDQRVNKMS